MTRIVQDRLRTTVLGAALISAVVAGVVAAAVIVLATALGVGTGTLSELPVSMVALWGVVTGVVTTLPVGAVCGAVVAAYVKWHLLSRGGEPRPAKIRAAAIGAILGAAYGAALFYYDTAGPSRVLLVIAGLVGGAAAGRVASAIVISDYEADLRTAA